MITFDDVSKSYPNSHQALAHVSFHVEPGEMAFVTGHSGAGKSTLLRLIAIVERSTQGQVLVGGKNLARLGRRQIAYYRRRVGITFQDHRLLTDRSVFDNVALPLVIAGYGHSEIGRRVRAALDTVGLLGKERVYPVALSGGEQQRVGIARAVVNRPAILLADEPTGNLDPDLSREVMHLFERFHQVGVTVLIASHDLDLIRTFGRRVITLRGGHLVDDTRSRRR
jgi:cell division transport system ATP-binding protein